MLRAKTIIKEGVRNKLSTPTTISLQQRCRFGKTEIDHTLQYVYHVDRDTLGRSVLVSFVSRPFDEQCMRLYDYGVIRDE